MHLKKVSIVNHDPGLKFGNPVFFFDVYDEESEDDGQSIVSNGTPIEVQLGQEIMQRTNANTSTSTDDRTLSELYSCRFTSQEKPIHSKIPSSGWKTDNHGLLPVPKVRWIPGSQKGSNKQEK